MSPGPQALKPCPFCGGAAEFERIGTGRRSCIVVCTDCGCRLETGETWSSGAAWNERAEPELTTIATALHRLATSTDPDADRCADALAALIEPLTPTSDQLVAWLEGHGWARASSPDGWQTMRRRLIHLDVPLKEGAPDYARCVRQLISDVAEVEHSRRSREVIDLWAWVQARDPSGSTPTPP